MKCNRFGGECYNICDHFPCNYVRCYEQGKEDQKAFCESCEEGIRNNAIEEYRLALHEKFESNKVLYGTFHSEYWNLSMHNVDEVADVLMGCK